jgi:hypothetical protein
MRNDYKYIHIEGDLAGLSTPVTYAAFVYLIFTALSLCVWSRAATAQNAAKIRLAAVASGEVVEVEEEGAELDLTQVQGPKRR